MTNLPITEIIVAFISGGTVWFWNKFQTKREKRVTDLSFIEHSMKTQQLLIERNRELTEQLLQKQQENLELRKEIDDMKAKIRLLESKVTKLEKKQ